METGAERPGVHPRDLRHDRQAQARRPRPWRLPGPHRRDGPLGVRPARGEDVFWSTADIGWVVGHGYIVYAPLIIGRTTIAYEGALDYPDADAPWAIIEREGVTGVFTSPTAVRLLMRYGEDVRATRTTCHASSGSFCAGEVLNPPAWEWLQQTVFDDRIPVIDHMWQTETGGPIFGNPYGIEMLPIKPGSAGLALPGHRRGDRRRWTAQPLGSARRGSWSSGGRSPA